MNYEKLFILGDSFTGFSLLFFIFLTSFSEDVFDFSSNRLTALYARDFLSLIYGACKTLLLAQTFVN
jgi:hypothetical protein